MLSFQNQRTAPELDAYAQALRNQKEKLGQIAVDSAGEQIHDKLHAIEQYGNIGQGLGVLQDARGAYKDITDKGGKALKQLAGIHGRVSEQLEDAKNQIGNLIRRGNQAPAGAPAGQRPQLGARFPQADDPNLGQMPRNLQQGAVRQAQADLGQQIRQLPQGRQDAIRQAVQQHQDYNRNPQTLADYQKNIGIANDAIDADRVAHAPNAQLANVARGAVGQAQANGQNIAGRAGAVYNRNAGARLGINRQGLQGAGQAVAGMDDQGNQIPRRLGGQVGRGVADLRGANAGAHAQLGNLAQAGQNAVAGAVNPHAQGGANALAQAQNDGGNLANRVMGGARAGVDAGEEALSTLGKVASVGGEVLDALGPVGDILGLGLSIFGGIEEKKEQQEKEQAEEKQTELVSQPIAKPTAGVGATLDTTKQQQVSATHY